MRSQVEKAVAFRALHERPGAFIIPNPWEAGTTKILAAAGKDMHERGSFSWMREMIGTSEVEKMLG